jgi:transcriptional regulator with XRE-family HTH domain
MTITRLQAFLTTNEIKPAHLARESGISRQHLLRLRQAVAEPTRAVMVALAGGCTRLIRRRVRVSELFDLGEASDEVRP